MIILSSWGTCDEGSLFSVSVKKLVAKIGCSESTIRRELRRGKVIQLSSELIKYKSYNSEIGQQYYDYHAGNKGPNLKITNDYDFVTLIQAKNSKHKYVQRHYTII